MKPVGAILTGGGSRRMGRPKALIDIDGVPMARRVADAARRGGCAPVVLIGGDRWQLASLGIDVVDDLYPGDGPVGAVLTALAAAPTGASVVVLPCDVPYFDAATVRRLIDTANDAPDADVVVVRSNRLQPTCALWRHSVVDDVAAMFADGVRALHEVLGRVRTVEIGVPRSVVVNINEPADLPEDQSERDRGESQ